MKSKRMSVAAILGLAVLSAAPARAGIVDWAGNFSEFWNNGGNWAPLFQPTSADVANFDDSVSAIVLRGAVKLSQNTTIAGWQVQGNHPFTGAYSFSRINGAVLTVTGATFFGDASTTTSTVTLDGFLLNTTTLTLSGQMTGVVTGNANINTTGDLDLFNSSVLNLNSSANITSGGLGINDSSVLNLNGGSLNLSAVGRHDINSGTMNVNGGALNLGANTRLSLFSGTSRLNFSGGYNILNGGIITQDGGDVVGTSFIDVGNGGAGFLTVNQTGSTLTAQTNISDWGRGASGNADVDILNGGVATVAALRVGTDNARANLDVFGGSLIVNSTLEAGGGTTLRTVQLTLQSSGTMTFNGAAVFNNQADLNFSSGTLNFNQNATFNAGSRFDRTGGTLNIASGKKLIINDGVYDDTRTSGQVLSSGAGIEVRGGAGRFNVNQFFDIANGSLLVENLGQYNSRATAATTDWAQSVNTSMTATVRNSGLINMGALRIAQNGSAAVNVQSNGRLETNALTVGGSSTSTGQITVNGGFVTVFGSATLGQGARMDLNDPAGSNTGQFTRFLVDGTLNMSGSAIIFTTGENPIISVDALNMTSPSQIVLRPGAELLVTYGATAAPLNTIRGYVAASRLFSDAITTDPRVAVGYVDFPDPQFGSMTVKLTLRGDTNLDGTVNFTDLLALARNYNGTNLFWQTGDFNYDGNVNFTDLLALARNYNQTLSGGQLSTLSDAGGGSFVDEWSRAMAVVPEPTTLALAAGVGLLCGRRRR